MSSNFTTFSYINNDTLSLINSLWHNVSDKQGRPTYMISGYVPVYDYRLDSSAESPFCEKFGEFDPSTNSWTSFPYSNTQDSPFNVLHNNLNGILFTDDIYFWKPNNKGNDLLNRYKLVKNSSANSLTEFETNYTLAIGYDELIEPGTTGLKKGTIKFLTDIKPYLLDTSFTGESIVNGTKGDTWKRVVTKIDNVDRTILKNVPVRSYVGVSTIENKVCIGNASPVYFLDRRVSNETTNIDYTFTIPKFDDISNFNTEISQVTAKSTSPTSTWSNLDPEFILDTSFPIINKVNQNIYGAPSSFTSYKVIDNGVLESSSYSLYNNIRHFSKAFTDDDGLEKSISAYRIQLNDQVGSIRFNKIVTYIRLYLKDQTGKWGWSDTLYPFTVTVLPEPVIKSDYGKPGIDSFELDIQIDYNQLIQSTHDNGSEKRIVFDTSITNHGENDGWSVLRNPLVTLSNNDRVYPSEVLNGFFGVQSDKRIFASTDVDISDFDNPGTTKNDSFNNKYGRINSENKTYVYYDVDFTKINFSLKDPSTGSNITCTTDYEIKFIDLNNDSVYLRTIGVKTAQKTVVYSNDSNGINFFNSAVASKYAAIESVQNSINTLREEYTAATNPAIKASKLEAIKAKSTTVEFADIKNQLTMNNIIDYSNNGAYFGIRDDKDQYTSFFKWKFDITGAQDAKSDFAEIGFAVKPKIDMTITHLGSDNVYNSDKLTPIRDIVTDTFPTGARDYAPSLIPDANRKTGLGRISSMWEHLFVNRSYFNTMYSSSINGRQIALARFDEQTGKPYSAFNEQYLYNKLVIGNSIYESIGAKKIELTNIVNGIVTFKANPKSNNVDITSEDNNTMSVIINSKNGNLTSYYQVADRDLVLNESTKNIYDNSATGTISNNIKWGFTDYSLFKRIYGYDYTNKHNLNDSTNTNINVDLDSNSKRRYNTLVVGEQSLWGRQFTTATNISNTSVISFNLFEALKRDGSEKQVTGSPVNTISAVSYTNKTHNNAYQNMVMLGSGFVLDCNYSTTKFKYSDMVTSTNNNYVFATRTVNSLQTMPVGLTVGSHGSDLIVNFKQSSTSNESLKAIVRTMFTQNTKDSNFDIAGVTIIDSPKIDIVLDILTGKMDESEFIGRGLDFSYSDGVRNRKGLVITNDILTNILMFPGSYNSSISNFNNNRIGSYYQTSPATGYTGSDQQWYLYSKEIMNYGKLYQIGTIEQKINTIGEYQTLYAAYDYNHQDETNITGYTPDYTDYRQYKYFAINRGTNSELTFDLNINRLNDGVLINYFEKHNLNSAQYPAQFGYDKDGSWFVKQYNQNIKRKSNVNDISETLTSNKFDYSFRINGNYSIIGSDIIPRRSFDEEFDVNYTFSKYNLFYLTNKRDYNTIAPSSISKLIEQKTSGITLGDSRTATLFDKIHTKVTYTNEIRYDLTKDYTDFITNNNVVPSGYKKDPTGNFFQRIYISSINDNGVLSDDDINYSTRWSSDIWAYAKSVSKPNATIMDVVNAITENYPTIDTTYHDVANKYSSATNDPYKRYLLGATMAMNTNVYGNLLPGIDRKSDNEEAVFTWEYIEQPNQLSRSGVGAKFNTYGQSYFTLGTEWRSYRNLSTNGLTTAVLNLIDSDSLERYPYIPDNDNKVSLNKFELDIIVKPIGAEDTSSITRKVLPMNTLDWNTGDIIPHGNSVLRYFVSNDEIYNNGSGKSANEVRRTGKIGPQFSQGAFFNVGTYNRGYIAPSAPSLGTVEKRFSDGYFNRLSVKIEGDLRETTDFGGAFFSRMESRRGKGGKAARDVQSNRPKSMLFGQDVHDSGYLEFINQPDRQDINTRSRFLMEPVGGLSYDTELSGATRNAQIGHALMWKHDINVSSKNKSSFDYDEKKVAVFQILPQMAFLKTSWSDPWWLKQYDIINEGDLAMPKDSGNKFAGHATMDLGGWYSGERNPGYDNSKWPNSQIDPYKPKYLYEFRNIYGQNGYFSSKLETPKVVGLLNGSQLGIEASCIVPIKVKINNAYITPDLGNKWNRWDDIWTNKSHFVWDSGDYTNSMLLEASANPQISIVNITRISDIAGVNRDITSSFMIGSGGQSQYNYVASGTGYNNDAYHATHAFSVRPWGGTWFNNFHTKWDWSYDNSNNPNGKPWDWNIRFSILPKMDTNKTFLDSKNISTKIKYAYPTMDLGGYDGNIDGKLYHFHTVHQWNVKTGTIGILGSGTGVDTRAVTLLDSFAFNGGLISHDTTTMVNRGYSILTWNGPDNSTGFAHPLFTEAKDIFFRKDGEFMDDYYGGAVLNDDRIYQSYQLLEGKMYETAKSIFNLLIRDIRVRNHANGRHFVSKNSKPELQASAEYGRVVNNRGIYGLHMIQGECVSHTDSKITTIPNTQYLPVYVAGDLLPTPRFSGDVKLTKNVTNGNWDLSRTPNPYYIQSSLGGPGYEWESIWGKTVIADTIVFNKMMFNDIDTAVFSIKSINVDNIYALVDTLTLSAKATSNLKTTLTDDTFAVRYISSNSVSSTLSLDDNNIWIDSRNSNNSSYIDVSPTVITITNNPATKTNKISMNNDGIEITTRHLSIIEDGSYSTGFEYRRSDNLFMRIGTDAGQNISNSFLVKALSNISLVSDNVSIISTNNFTLNNTSLLYQNFTNGEGYDNIIGKSGIISKDTYRISGITHNVSTKILGNSISFMCTKATNYIDALSASIYLTTTSPYGNKELRISGSPINDTITQGYITTDVLISGEYSRKQGGTSRYNLSSNSGFNIDHFQSYNGPNYSKTHIDNNNVNITGYSGYRTDSAASLDITNTKLVFGISSDGSELNFDDLYNPTFSKGQMSEVASIMSSSNGLTLEGSDTYDTKHTDIIINGYSGYKNQSSRSDYKSYSLSSKGLTLYSKGEYSTLGFTESTVSILEGKLTFNASSGGAGATGYYSNSHKLVYDGLGIVSKGNYNGSEVDVASISFGSTGSPSVSIVGKNHGASIDSTIGVNGDPFSGISLQSAKTIGGQAGSIELKNDVANMSVLSSCGIFIDNKTGVEIRSYSINQNIVMRVVNNKVRVIGKFTTTGTTSDVYELQDGGNGTLVFKKI